MARRRSFRLGSGRSRRSSPAQPGAVLALLAVALVAAYPWHTLALVSLACAGAAGAWLLARHRRWRRGRALRQLELCDVDAMDPRGFEEFVAELLTAQGYQTSLTPHSYDFGVDVVAIRGSRRIAVQVKHYRNPVSNAALAEALLGMPHYCCSECMVVTNSRFTRAAVRSSEPHPCTLIDRDALAEWLWQARQTSQ